MRISSALFLALPLLAAAEEQKPLKAWLDKLSSYIPSAVQHPIENAAAKSAKVHVTHVTMYNLKDTLVPNGQPQEWWVYVTGGNTTCFGQCKITGQAWNESAALIQASSHPPKLGTINCEASPILCNIWSAKPPALWRINIPATVGEPTEIRIKELNSTTTTASELLSLRTAKKWDQVPVYDGPFHPFDGILSKLGLNVVVGYVLYVYNLLPSWFFMVAISFISRNWMAKRQQRVGGPNPYVVASPGDAPAAT
ncbi:MAG: hypothetical protein M1824_002293 [Vezdaea acicularis]|nr:MAG: hypothetical protein M1824_002293 [Vezdaea acicularis]